MMSQEHFTENDIRPEHLLEEQRVRVLRDIHRLLQHAEKFIETTCPACGSSDRTLKFEKHQLKYNTCNECATVYVSPRPPKPVLDEYYQMSENYQYWAEHIFPASEQVRREKIFKPRAAKIGEIYKKYAHKIAEATLVEVGAGFGTFCQEIRQYNQFKRVVAIEPTPALAQACIERGLEVINRPVEEVDLSVLSADIIVSFEVIEHLLNPGEFIENCARLLNDRGIITLTCPNVMGFDLKMIGKHSDIFDVEHLNYFHPDSLSKLLTLHGFRVLEILTPGKLDAELVRKAVLNGLIELQADSFLNTVLMDNWEKCGESFQEFLAENKLSSHLWIVAQKS